MLFIAAIHQSAPLQVSPAYVDSNTARLAKSALARNIKRINHHKQRVIFDLSVAELTSMIEIIERTNPDISTHFNLTSNGLYIESTIKSRWQRYINLSLLITPSTTGINIERLTLGDLDLPTDFSITFIDYLLQQFSGIKLLSHINNISMTNHSIVVGYNMVNDKAALINSLSHLARRFGSQHIIDNNLRLTELYYRQLHKIQRHSGQCTIQPLSYFIHSLNQFSAVLNQQGYSAVEQNRAAIFALAAYFGSYRFEYIIGKLAPELPRKPRCYAIPTLDKRRDLTQHFIYSAAIELLSSKQTSEFIGELKELLDSNLNGSGFSFVDLMADRAGVLFAQLATENEASAIYHQQIIALKFDDQDLFPPNVTLPEDLSQDKFETVYQHIDAPAYLALITQIDAQLMSLPLYQRPE